MNIKTRFLTVLIFAVLASPLAAIDYISYVGATVDSPEVNRWLTDSVPKSMSADGDNTYGTLTKIQWGRRGIYTGPGDVPSTKWGSSGTQYASADYVHIDDINNPSSTYQAGICIGNYSLNFVQNFDRVRIGVMWDVLTADREFNSVFGEQLLTMSVGSATSGAITTATENRAADIYFFDLVNVKAGESFRLDAGKNTTNHGAYAGAGPAHVILPEIQGFGGVRRSNSLRNEKLQPAILRLPTRLFFAGCCL